MNPDLLRDGAVALLAISVMLAVGFGMDLQQLRAVLRKPGALVAALGFEHLVVPLSAFALATVLGAPPLGVLAVVLCAATPGGPVGPALVLTARGDVAFSVAMVLLMAMINVVATPLTLELLGLTAQAPRGFVAALVKAIVLYQLIPLAVAMSVRAWRPAVATRLGRVATRTTQVMIAGITLGMLAMRWRLALELESVTLLAIFGTSVLAIGGGMLLAVGGPARRRALGITAGMRNVGLAMLVANVFGEQVLLVVMLYGLAMLVTAGSTAAWLARRPLPETA